MAAVKKTTKRVSKKTVSEEVAVASTTTTQYTDMLEVEPASKITIVPASSSMAETSFFDNNILTIQTVQIPIIRTLFAALKDLISDTNIIFDATGMKIATTDKSHTSFVHLHLEASKFEYYECKKDKIVICVNIQTMGVFINNSSDNNDILSIYIDNSNYVDGVVNYLSFKFDNREKRQSLVQNMQVLNLDNDEQMFPNNLKYMSIINLPSADFQKHINQFHKVSDRIEIENVGNELYFRCEGTLGNMELRRMDSDGLSAADNIRFIAKQDSSKIIQGVFSLKTLGMFVKCTNLCDQLELYLDNIYPLILKYNVGTLGAIRLCLPSTRT